MDQSGFYYTNAYWYDVDGDGDFDLVTARTNKPTGTTAELIFLENPGTGLGDWTEHHMADGPDLFF